MFDLIFDLIFDFYFSMRNVQFPGLVV